MAELSANRTDLMAYNTQQSARDVLALMRAPGYADHDIKDVSYGTIPELEVMGIARPKACVR